MTGKPMSESATQRIAIIDLGSNTARLVVMSAIPGYAYHLDDEIREVVRLREGMTAHGLSETAVARALFTLRLFKRFCDSSKVDQIIPTATSAVREAKNGPRFVERVKREIGLSLRVLDGQQEAYYGVLGVLNEAPINNGFIVDIGGGSAQVSEVRDRRFKQGQDFPLGALALTERFISDRDAPIKPAELTAVRAEIQRHLTALPWLHPLTGEQTLVGLGGTLRNLASMAAARQHYPLNTLHGFRLPRADLDESIELLATLPLRKRQKLAGLSSDRADIILSGALVIQAIMAHVGAATVTISVNGLREGLFFEHFWQHLAYPVVDNVRRYGVLNMARTYRYDKRHASHVRFLAGRLFNQLAPLFGYGQPERELLDAAALLHDIGTVISYYDHHKHSQTLIINSGLPGFTSRETALIALLTRYHRKGTPTIAGYESILNEQDEALLLRLSAILRLAEFLERGRNATVDDITVLMDDASLRLMLIADEYPAVEMWEAERNALELMAAAFGREVTLECTAVPDAWFRA
jgi:exopolyphosphatase / guanosine-5'-triphosphate,3'-diphosphate pyrophosphatase